MTVKNKEEEKEKDLEPEAVTVTKEGDAARQVAALASSSSSPPPPSSTTAASDEASYFLGCFEHCEEFEVLFHRLESLELYKELAVVNIDHKDQCHPDDIRFLFPDDDDQDQQDFMSQLRELDEHITSVRKEMNNCLPPIEQTLIEKCGYLKIKPSTIHHDVGLGLFYEAAAAPSESATAAVVANEDDGGANGGLLANSNNNGDEGGGSNDNNTDVSNIDNNDYSGCRGSSSTIAATATTTKDHNNKTKNYLPANTVVCYYTGRIHTIQSSRELQEQGYVMLVGGGNNNVAVDPYPCPQIIARYINDPLNSNYYNVKFVTSQPNESNYRSAVITTRDIQNGEELFISYGDYYWSNVEKMNQYTPRRMV